MMYRRTPHEVIEDALKEIGMATESRVIGGTFKTTNGDVFQYVGRVDPDDERPVQMELPGLPIGGIDQFIRGLGASAPNDPVHHVQPKFVFQQTDGKDAMIANVELWPQYGVMWLHNLWVAESKRRQGRGRCVMEKLLAQLGHSDIYLQVGATDSVGLTDLQLYEFYRKFGFRSTKIPGVMRRFPYGDTTDDKGRERREHEWVREL